MLEQQREHWKKLHTKRMGADELADWINTIPLPDQCPCKSRFMEILKDHPPIFDDWEKWTWTVHNIVNTKLGKQLIAWTDAITLWNWPIKDIPKDGSTENAGKNTS